MNRDQLIRALQSFIAPLARRIRVIAQRGQVLLTKYNGKIRVLQIQVPGGQALSDVEHLEPFGYTSNPPKGAEAIVLAFGGNGSHSVGLLVGDRRYRLVVEEGETGIYNQFGDFLKLGKDRIATLKTDAKVILDTPTTELTGALNVAGATTLQSTLNVTGDTTLQSTLNVIDSVVMATSATVIGPLSAVSTQVSGTASVTALTINGVSYSSHAHSYTDNGNAMTTGGPQ